MKDTADSTAINKTLTALDNYVLLGKSGLRVSPLSLGTMTFGEEWGFGNNKETCKQIFDMYHEKGGNFYDTANIYTNGDSERFLGEYMADKRSECVIATKYSINPSATEALAGRFSRPNPNAGGNHRKNLVESLDGSLKRLGTGYVDILYVHLWEYRTPIKEVMRALDDVVRAGKALYVAVSDTPSWVVSSANTMADLRGLSPFIGFQTRYNLLNRSLESDIQPMCADHGIGIVPWSVLAEGFLSGKHSRDQKASDSKRKGQVSAHFKDDKNWRILDEVKAIAQECNRTPAQVAVNWTLQKPGITSPLIGVRTLKQLEDNLGALEFTLTESQMARLDLVSNPKEWPFPHDVARNLEKFTGLGVSIEMPKQFHALQKLRTSKI
ncbi:aldo/keto reductase [Gamsiella multidivaricata]|uniref:aldo/keto reductase n=1 Tax=Gamsiella multidivaricata TaxID=101098 RepID=UPI0022205B68|nr:aldo/keto reductase [Gamsiella multidivaricata]KAG0366834.1 hypothetical protein BGZ54_004829 [Gamsiella multidivaricata]KAI7828972.1 aldo/keto reductase [Gamsiella multidivaricata]